MPKKYRKKGRSTSALAKRLKQFPAGDGMYVAQLDKELGDGAFAMTIDAPGRIQAGWGKIRGVMRRKIRVHVNDLVLVQAPSFGNDSASDEGDAGSFSYTGRASDKAASDKAASDKATHKVEKVQELGKVYILYGSYTASDLHKMVKDGSISARFLSYYKNNKKEEEETGFDFETGEIDVDDI